MMRVKDVVEQRFIEDEEVVKGKEDVYHGETKY